MTNLASRVSRVPRTCVWEITTACNLRCIHCELEAGEAREGELDERELLEAADALSALGCTNVSLTGGEPLVRREWPALASRLAGHGIDVKLVTNGVLVDGATVELMAASGVAGAAVSLDGPREVHDRIRVPASRMGSRYDAAVRALELLAGSPIRTAAITQIHRGNIDSLPAMHDMLASMGIDAWQVQLAFPLGRLLRLGEEYLVSPSEIPRLERMLAGFIEKGRMSVVAADNIGYYGPNEPLLRTVPGGMRSFWTGCMAGCLGVCVCSNGDVKGCPTHPDSFVVGNLRTEPLATIWHDSSRFSYNTMWDEDLLEGECAGCSFRKVCRAGCTSMAYAVTGTIYDNPYCLQRAGR